MGLRHPRDLAAWSSWQERRHTLRFLKSRLRPPTAAKQSVQLAGSQLTDPSLLVVLDSGSPTERAALLEPLAILARDIPFVVAAPHPMPMPDELGLSAAPWTSATPDDLRSLARRAPIALTLGHYLPLGRLVHSARPPALPLTVVQHGLLTPAAPPLPPGCNLLAWSAADATFWATGRSDVSAQAVGSQLLYDAGATPSSVGISRFLTPVFLGQLHAAELSRAQLTRAATEFCLREHAAYRPHPSESDRLSRLQHDVWQRLGIEVSRSNLPLREIDRPVVSVFSTGVLEAAAAGLPSWVYHPNPPAWLGEFWARYSMHRWGDTPTPRPSRADGEPAHRVADYLRERV